MSFLSREMQIHLMVTAKERIESTAERQMNKLSERYIRKSDPIVPGGTYLVGVNGARCVPDEDLYKDVPR